jgi:hypothetical protein
VTVRAERHEVRRRVDDAVRLCDWLNGLRFAWFFFDADEWNDPRVIPWDWSENLNGAGSRTNRYPLYG